MRVNPISVNYLNKSGVRRAQDTPVSQPEQQAQSFKGKHTCAKAGAGIFGTCAAIGAIGGSIIMTGGISLIPLLAAYTATGAATGALIGHEMDKYESEQKKKSGKKD